MWDLECVHMPHSDVTQDDRLIKYWSWAKQKTWWPSRCPIPCVINHVCSCTQKLIRLNLSYLVESIIWVNSCTEGSCRGWHCSLGRSGAAKIERVNPTRSSVVTKNKQTKKKQQEVYRVCLPLQSCACLVQGCHLEGDMGTYLPQYFFRKGLEVLLGCPFPSLPYCWRILVFHTQAWSLSLLFCLLHFCHGDCNEQSHRRHITGGRRIIYAFRRKKRKRKNIVPPVFDVYLVTEYQLSV